VGGVVRCTVGKKKKKKKLLMHLVEEKQGERGPSRYWSLRQQKRERERLNLSPRHKGKKKRKSSFLTKDSLTEKEKAQWLLTPNQKKKKSFHGVGPKDVFRIKKEKEKEGDNHDFLS